MALLSKVRHRSDTAIAGNIRAYTYIVQVLSTTEFQIFYFSYKLLIIRKTTIFVFYTRDDDQTFFHFGYEEDLEHRCRYIIEYIITKKKFKKKKSNAIYKRVRIVYFN